MPRRSAPETPPWTTGFWFWNGSSAQSASIPVDVLYTHVGVLEHAVRFGREEVNIFASLPQHLPDAKEYWLVYRFEGRGVPPLALAPRLSADVRKLCREAESRRLRVAGVQLDVDSPTRSLAEFAAFLRETRKGLTPGVRLSVTALLDWFRSGTDVGRVLDQVDEYVPQFYDVGERIQGAAVAARIDAARWGPIFRRYEKPVRIGVSAFGRSRFIPDAGRGGKGIGIAFFGDVSPLDLATDEAFRLTTGNTEARELVLRYRASQEARIGYSTLASGDAFEFVMPTEASVAEAVEAAKKMGRPVTGVVFFRWPAFNEVLALQPDQVLRAAGVLPRGDRVDAQVSAYNRECAAVRCTDLYLTLASHLFAEPLRFTIRSSSNLEYFVPAERMPARMSGPAEIEVGFPPYGARPRMYLGRAVTAASAGFTLAEGL
jgi:hypothetical protein